ncbi:MAG: M16 family metallopeptidase [Armatimonadota bacterium]
MKPGKLFLCVLAALLCTTTFAAPIISSDTIRTHTLDNGLRVIVQEERTWPVVSMGLYIKAGSIHEGADRAGAAHMVEHLLFEAKTDNGDKLAPYVESIGGRITASTLRDFTLVKVTVAESFIEEILPKLLQAVLQADFQQQALEREKTVIAREIADRTKGGGGYLDVKLWEQAFEDHPYQRPIGGTSDQVKQLTIEKLKDFYDEFYVPNNMSLIVAGRVDPDWLIGRTQELTDGIQSREIAWQPPTPEIEQDTVRKDIQTRDSEITALGFAWHAPGMPDKEDICAMDIIYTLLGQQHVGRVQEALRDREVPAVIECHYLTQFQPGLMMLTAGVHGDGEITVRNIILEEITRLRSEKVSEEALDRAKRLLRTEYAFTNESYSGQIGSMGFYEAIDTYEFAIDYIDYVNAVTAQDVQDVARKYLDPEAYTLVILRPKSSNTDTQEVKL